MGTFASAVVRMLKPLVNEGALLPYAGDWMPPEHLDRLRQYEIFRALHENRIGGLLKDKEAAKKIRGYGDYSLVVETSRDAVLGDRIEIEVPGSSDEGNAGAVARKTLLDEWARRQRWASKMYRCETDAAAVGDCVYELRPNGSRLLLRAHDPESFFPVWENAEGDFDEAYLAWEERNTGQYLPSPPANMADLHNRDGQVVLYRRHYEMLSVQEARDRGVTTVGARTRTEICIVTSGWFRIENRSGEKPVGFERLERLGFELTEDGDPIDSLDTGFDTPPLFYIPNREATGQPWGLPEGDVVLQTLLDAAQDQSDLKENTYANAFPVMYDENPPVGAVPRPGQQQGHAATRSQEKYKPGMIYNGRKLGVVDMSHGNELLMKHEEWLIAKALSNSRTTLIAAGKLEGGEIPSGIALMIALLPLFAKTLPKRQTRKDKLGMMLKHVLRWHRDFGKAGDFFGSAEDAANATATWPEGIWSSEEAYPSFGSIIPIDKKQVSEIVASLITAGAISDETAVTMLLVAGFPIDDATKEVERLKEARALPPGAPGSGFGNEGVPIPGIGEV